MQDSMQDTSSELPPSLPPGDFQHLAPSTRSELLDRRRNESRDILQGSYDSWEAANPVWAQRLTGKDAAAALGIDTSAGPSDAGSRRAMMQQRKVTSREQALQASGFAPSVQEQLNAHEPNQLHTSIARATEDLSMDWVHDPRNRTRAELIQERKQTHVKELQAMSESRPDANARVQQRMDNSIQSMLSAPPGKSRAALLAARRQRRAVENEDLAAAYGVDPAATFAAQAAPFWQLNRNKGHEVEVQERPAYEGSHEQMKTAHRWYARAEMYPRLHPDAPRYAEPFKLAQEDMRYLQRKLSSGPRKAQRGYPPEARTVADKVAPQPYARLPTQHYLCPSTWAQFDHPLELTTASRSVAAARFPKGTNS